MFEPIVTVLRQAITVDITRARNARAAPAARTLAVDDESSRSRSHGAQVYRCTTSRAEYDVSAACIHTADRIAS